MHLFASDPFLESFAEAHHPGRPVRVERVAVDGLEFRLPVVDGRPVVGGPFFDFAPSLGPAAGGAVRRSTWIPRAAVEVLEAGPSPAVPEGSQPAPFIDWGRFPDWAAFEAHYLSRRSTLVKDGRSKRRGLEREFGKLTFVRDDPRPEVLERCFAWKSAQYVETGLPDLFRRPENVALFHGLRRRGVLVVSSLWGGERLLAAHAGVAMARAFFAWVPAYDPGVARYSPGRLLFEELMQASREAGDELFDFLVGDAQYKWFYATHWRRVTGVGRRPLGERLLRASRRAARTLLERHPSVLARARALRNRLAERGIGG